ncbi:hypothetical protein ACFQ6N_34315 [Kitasatospora sp. NPDC056446]|uniref:hypothetical protein n=1 Tax=Kitasatospora sp. NPDC056446 TaxID=3345819 RepID=UPI0036782088
MGSEARSWHLDAVVQATLSWSEEPVAAASRLDGLLRAATPAELACLEAAYRGRRYSIASLGILADRQAPDGPHALSVAALMSFDRSGYLREAGVTALGASPDPFALPFLLLRLGDPVEQVRESAQRAVAARLGSEHVGLLVRLLPLLDAVRGRRRAGPVLTTVEGLLRRSGAEELRQGARAGDPAMRASCLRWLALTEPTRAVATAFATKDPGLWQWAARVATSSKLTAAEQDAVLPLLEDCAGPRIRLRAVRARARRPNGEEHLRRAVIDPDARVRYHARAALYARGHTDLAPQVYRDALAPDDVPDATAIGALGGLSDLGGACDVPRVLDFTAHPKARVRAEAWRTLGILAPGELERRAARLAGDPSARVRRHLPGRAPA